MHVITSLDTDQTIILRNILALHGRGATRYHADITYSTGSFWRYAQDIAPTICMDLLPRKPRGPGLPPTNVQGDVRALPFTTGSLQSVVFDPPFMHAPGKNSIMGQRFGGYPTQKALLALYKGALAETARCLVPKGLLVFKCQDCVESGKQTWNHCLIKDAAEALGFVQEDLFVLHAPNRLIGHNHGRQQHARKTHSYFLVFRRSRFPWA